MQHIVVGVDGSDESRKALQWALDEARLRAATLEVVHVWTLPYAGSYPFAMPAFDSTELERGAVTLVEHMLTTVDTSGLGEPVRTTVLCGSAAAVLLEQRGRRDARGGRCTWPRRFQPALARFREQPARAPFAVHRGRRAMKTAPAPD